MKLEDAAGILGVPTDSDLEVLKQKYRKLALACHPEKVLAGSTVVNLVFLFLNTPFH